VAENSTRYVQDLAAPLSQVLNDGTANYVYGLGRLRALSGPWYLGDALGSVRATLTDSGAVLATAQYDPYGSVEGSAIAPFGFTGELQAGSSVYLRARWYNASDGRFGSRDPFAGFDPRPYSLHSFQYAYANPILYSDPTGERVYRIWAAAFIKPAQFDFVYLKAWGGVGNWHGDGRDFTKGEYDAQTPNSRVWHEVVIDVQPGGTTILDANTGTGQTRVDYLAGSGLGALLPPIPATDVDQAPQPEPARIDTNTPCITIVSIKVDAPEGTNPLFPSAPSLRYEYELTFDLLTGQLQVNGQRSRFPWHELYVESEQGGILTAQEPLTLNPFLLAYPDVPLTSMSIPIPQD
jgi:RHS repeat-associated protein